MTDTTTTTTTAQPAELEEQGALVVQRAQAITITDAATYEAADELLCSELQPTLKQIEATFRPMQRAADKAKREILDQRKAIEGPILQAKKVLTDAMGAWQVEQKRLEEEAEAKRAREAREAAEEQRLAEASRLEEGGHQEAAEERLEAPVVPVMAAPAPEKPKTTSSARMIPDFRILDEGKISRAFLTPDEKKIRGVVKSMGADAVELVGEGSIEVFERPVISGRSK